MLSPGKPEETGAGIGPQGLPAALINGLDSLYVSYFLDMTTGKLDFEELEYQKQRLKADKGRQFIEISLGSETFALRPYGRNRYAYVLANEAFEIRLTELMQPSCYVQFFSKALWTEGVGALLERFEAWRESLELRPRRPERVSRADWAFDFHLPSADFIADDFVSRAAKDATHRDNRAEQTFTFGKGDVVVRVYDKVAEIEQQSGKA